MSSPFAAGMSSGEISVSRIERSVWFTCSSNCPEEITQRMRCCMSVLGTPGLTVVVAHLVAHPKVHQPSASSERSPVPSTIPPFAFARRNRKSVRRPAWTFSKVTS